MEKCSNYRIEDGVYGIFLYHPAGPAGERVTSCCRANITRNEYNGRPARTPPSYSST